MESSAAYQKKKYWFQMFSHGSPYVAVKISVKRWNLYKKYKALWKNINTLKVIAIYPF